MMALELNIHDEFNESLDIHSLCSICVCVCLNKLFKAFFAQTNGT